MLTAHHLQVQATATGPLELREHTGASLRGVLVNTLLSRFCTNREATACSTCMFVQGCPISALVAPLREEARLGRNIPRPYAIRPPVHHAQVFAPGESFTFGLTLFGCRIELFPYVAIGLAEMGKHGIGRRVPENAWERGKFRIEQVQAVNLLSGEAQVVLQSGNNLVHVPDMPMTLAHAQTQAEAQMDDGPTTLQLRFLTPLRLTSKKQLVKQPHLQPLVARLVDRHDSLAREYGGEPLGKDAYQQMTAAAAQVELLDNATRWVDLGSYSRRSRRATPIGGLVGSATYRGDGALRELLPLLAWGSVIQVGKDTTKGNGVYEVKR
jgi:hypothetical protein